MASKKRPSTAAAVDDGGAAAPILDSLKPMERRKRRKALDKSSRHPEPHLTPSAPPPQSQPQPTPAPPPSSAPELHVNLFRSLSSPDTPTRSAAVAALVAELRAVQNAFEAGGSVNASPIEADKHDGLEDCAESLRYAVRRLIRGVSSSRECARQGFALALAAVVAGVPAVRVESVMKLVVELLEVSSSMKGQEARDSLLGRLFAYGALARSGRVVGECVSEFVASVVSLADRKRYLREPAVTIILDVAEKLPTEALSSQFFNAPGVSKWFENAVNNGDPDVLFLALKLQERISVDSAVFGKLLPYPFSSDNFFSRDHLLSLTPCFKESTFCTPRVHSLWPLLVEILVRDMRSQDEVATTRSTNSKKHKKSRKAGSFEETTKNVRNVFELVIEDSFLQSSHDRKHLAFNVVLLILPSLPTSCIPVILSHKFVNCLTDILSTEGSWLYNAAQHFLKELLKWADDDHRRVGVIIALQKHSGGRFDYLTRTHTVKELVSKFKTEQGCMLFVHELTSLFLDQGIIVDEPSDQSDTTEENSEIGSLENKENRLEPENSEFLKIWVIDTIPRILKNIKLDSNAESRTQSETEQFLETKYRLQMEILKFLAVQGLFTASLGTEVTSFELQEKFTWPKVASSSSLRKMCIEQLQSLLEDAQKGEGLPTVLDVLAVNDLGSYFMRFLTTLSSIPSVSVYRILNAEDETAFKELQAVESKLSCEERNFGPGTEAKKIHALRYLLIQLLLQVLLHPNEFSEAASELVICCKKSFPAISSGDSSEEEDEFNDNDKPSLMDVIVDTLLSLLPQSSSALRFAVEQVFRVICDYITDDGLLQMLRIVKKDLKPARHQVAGSDDDDDLLEIEDAEEMDEVEAGETADSDDHGDVSEGMDGIDATGEESAKNDEADSEELDGGEEPDIEAAKTDEGLSDSDDSDGGLDDDAMFRMDHHLVRLFKERKVASGHDNANLQLVPFKLRVLALLEIYLQRNSGNSQVLTIYSHLAKAFVKYHTATAEGGEQLGQRISGILQKKIIKAKDYPKGIDIQLTDLVLLLEKCLKSASRSRHKVVSSFAQASTFWILKIIHARNFSTSELENVGKIFQLTVADYFSNKKCRLKFGFVKEVIHRHPWLGLQLFSFLLEKCGNAESEFRQIEAVDAVGCIMKSWTAIDKEDEDALKRLSKLLKKHIPTLCELFHKHLCSLPAKPSRRGQVRQFCRQALRVILLLKLKKTFLKSLKQDAYSACESQLAADFDHFKLKPVTVPASSQC